MDKETLSHYGWIVIAVLIIAVMLALATPFGVYIKGAFNSTTAGFADVNSNANGILASLAAPIYDAEGVVKLFEKVEPLESIQTKRSEYTDAESWNKYVKESFEAQSLAIKAYESLSEEDKAIVKETIGEEQLSKLMDTELDTVFNRVAFTVTKGTADYHYQAAFYSNRAYEIGTHISYGESGGHPMTVAVVDTNKITGSWAPSDVFTFGESEFDVLYCCEADKPVKHKTFYKKVNIEDADYFGVEEAAKIRALVLNSYPYVSLETMISNLKAEGFVFADDLTRGDIITAVQFAIWRYSNATYKHAEGIDKYGETTNNTQLSYAKAYHDYTNELWHWWASGRNATHYEAAQEIKINALVNHLCSRAPVYAGNTNRVITDMDLINSDAVKQANGTYDVTLTVKLNATVSNQDNVVITVKNAGGELSSVNAVAGQDTYSMSFNTSDISSMTVSANGTQNLGTDAYLYIPLGGKEVSQVLVGMSSGETVIKTEMTVHGAE